MGAATASPTVLPNRKDAEAALNAVGRLAIAMVQMNPGDGKTGPRYVSDDIRELRLIYLEARPALALLDIAADSGSIAIAMEPFPESDNAREAMHELLFRRTDSNTALLFSLFQVFAAAISQLVPIRFFINKIKVEPLECVADEIQARRISIDEALPAIRLFSRRFDPIQLQRGLKQERAYILSRLPEDVADSSKPDGTMRPAGQRDALWLKWYEEDGLTAALIRNKWNSMTDSERQEEGGLKPARIDDGDAGRRIVESGLSAARRDQGRLPTIPAFRRGKKSK